MSGTDWLWEELHGFFEVDDGSLPEILIHFRNPEAIESGYLFLRDLAVDVSPDPAVFWSVADNAERPVDTVPNAAALVVRGDAEPFHAVFGGIRMGEVTIPDLGVFVFHDHLGVDYRMGSEWHGEEVRALFDLLLRLSDLDPGPVLSLSCMPPEVEEVRFHEAWNRFVKEHRVTDPRQQGDF